MNEYLSSTFQPGIYPRLEPFNALQKIQRPSSTIQFLLMTRSGAYAVSDHVHVEGWGPPAMPPKQAASEVQTNAYGGSENSWNARSNWSFLDGHAETLLFKAVYTNFSANKFDPQVAR